MKKNLIVALALVFVLGIAGTAFAAANPFVDVPAKHWAYDAVSKLAKAGILDGYGDGTYRGERLASRYEMAQATAKAMARADKADAQMKALIDKLAVEFAAELNNLGVRVAKLEKNASTIKFWGDSRLRYQSNWDLGTLDSNSSKASGRFDQRIRVYAKADVNDKATFYGRLMANWTDRPSTVDAKSTQSDVYWDYGYFEWTLNPEWKVAIGRQQLIAGQDLFWTNGGYDSIQFKYATDKFSGKFAFGDVGPYYQQNAGATAGPISSGQYTGAKTQKPVWIFDANYKASKDWTINGAIYWSTDDQAYNFNVYNLGVMGKLNQDFSLKANYWWNTNNVVKNFFGQDQTGWMSEIWYKGADKAKVGSWGLAINYRDIKPYSLDTANASGLLGNSGTGTNMTALGVKGWGFQANYTLSKNAVLTATYETLDTNYNFGTNVKLAPFYYVQLNVGF